MAISLDWNHDHYCCRLEITGEQDQPIRLRLSIPRQLTYGGCNIPTGILTLLDDTDPVALSPATLEQLIAHVAEIGRLLRCPLLLTEDRRLLQLGLPLVPVLPAERWQAPATLFQALGASSYSDLREIAPDQPGITSLRNLATVQQVHRLQLLSTDWAERQPGTRWLGWGEGEQLAGYAEVAEAADSVQVRQCWAADGDYRPLCAYLAVSRRPVELKLCGHHPLAKVAFQAGALHCCSWFGLAAWPSSMQQLLTCVQRELSARLRESRFFQYSGDIGIVVGAEKISLRVVRGGIIDVYLREEARPGWPVLDPDGMLRAFFGQQCITEAVIADPQPTALHLLDIIFSPRHG